MGKLLSTLFLCFLISSIILAVNGQTYSGDPQEITVLRLKSLANRRHLHGTLAFGNYCLIFGGTSDGTNPSANVEILNFTLSQTSPTLSTGISLTSSVLFSSTSNIAVASNNLAFLHGYSNNPTTTIMLFNETSTAFTWSTNNSLISTSRKSSSVVAGCNSNFVFVAGGLNTGNTPLNLLNIYNTSNNLWTTAKVLSEARHGIAVASSGSYVIFAGGFTTSALTSPSATLDIYNCDSGIMSSTISLSSARGYAATAVVGTAIFIIGGRNATSPSTRTIDRFETSNSTLTTFSLPIERGEHDAIGLGNLLVISCGNQACPYLLIYDTLSQQWSKAYGTVPQRAFSRLTLIGTDSISKYKEKTNKKKRFIFLFF